MPEELCLKTALELRALIAARSASPVEIVEAVLSRIERLQPVLNCFITVCADEARAAARESAHRVANTPRSEPLRLLEGIPFTAKDLIDTAGVRTTFGSLINQHNVPQSDAAAIARLKAAGANTATKPSPMRRCSAARATPGAQSAPARDPVAAPQPQSPPASRLWRWPPTGAGRPASPRQPMAWSASSRPSA